jgi:UDP-N-acetylglucosamine:LPS N-acetylglucosamine transferase
MIEDEALDADRLVEVAGLLSDPSRHALMSAAARDAARPGAASAVGDLVMAVAYREPLPSQSETDAAARRSRP